MSYNIPKNLFSPDSSGHLQCNDQQLLDVGAINWYDSSVEYTGSVLFGNTLYFQPSTGNGTYLFRGSASTRFLQIQVTTSDATVLSGANTTRILTRTQNASGTLQWNAGAGTSANMVLSTDELQLRNGADFQRIHIYATYTDSSNYERLEVGSNGVQHRILSQSQGTGTSRSILIGGATVQFNNNITPVSNDTFQCGTSSLRWSRVNTSGIATDVETFTATDTLDSKNHVCLCDATTGNITLNLPVASSTPVGIQYQIKKIDSSSNTVIITPNSGAGDLIDGSATYTLSNQWEGVIIVCDGGDWYVTGGVTNSGGGGGGGGGLGGGD